MEVTDIVGGKESKTEMPFAPFEVEFNIERASMLIGKHLGEEKIETILKALEIKIAEKQAETWKLLVPRYRVDVQRECDVVEDILRIYGYNNIEFPEKVNTNLVYGKQPDPVFLQRRISEQLTAQGFNEIMNNSLTKTSYYEGNTVFALDNAVKIMNPLSSDLGVMRQTLLYGGLESIERNANRQNADLKFYEFGNCYHYHGKSEGLQIEPIKAYSEEMHLGLWLTGNKEPQSWVRKEEKTSFYQLHAYVQNILRRLGVNIDRCTYEDYSNPLFADGLRIIAPNGKQIGVMAIVAKSLLKQFDIDAPVYYADLEWKVLLKQNKQYKPVISDLPRFPEVRRDLALLVDKSVMFADLRKAAFETERKLLREVYLFDVYEGKTLDFGKKSYALSFILQDTENTLKDKQIENIMQRLTKTFEDKFGARLRQ